MYIVLVDTLKGNRDERFTLYFFSVQWYEKEPGVLFIEEYDKRHSCSVAMALQSNE